MQANSEKKLTARLSEVAQKKATILEEMRGAEVKMKNPDSTNEGTVIMHQLSDKLEALSIMEQNWNQELIALKAKHEANVTSTKVAMVPDTRSAANDLYRKYAEKQNFGTPTPPLGDMFGPIDSSEPVLY